MDENNVEVLEQQVQSENGEETLEKKTEEIKVCFLKRCFSKKNRKKSAVAIAAFVVVIAAVCIVLSYLSPGNVAKRFVKAEITHDINTLASVMPFDIKDYMIGDYSEEEFFEQESDYYGEDISNWRDLSRCYLEMQESEFEDEYGEYKLSFQNTRVKDISIKKLEDELDELEEYEEDYSDYGFVADEVTDAKVAIVKVKLEGEDETERETCTVYLVKIGGFWKVLDYDY